MEANSTYGAVMFIKSIEKGAHPVVPQLDDAIVQTEMKEDVIRHVASMIHSAEPTVPDSSDHYFSLENCFVLRDFQKTDVQTTVIITSRVDQSNIRFIQVETMDLKFTWPKSKVSWGERPSPSHVETSSQTWSAWSRPAHLNDILNVRTETWKMN